MLAKECWLDFPELNDSRKRIRARIASRMMNVTWMVISGAGFLITLGISLARHEILASDLARLGGGLSSHFSGKGIQNPSGGNPDLSDSGVMDAVHEDGKPILRGTRRFLR